MTLGRVSDIMPIYDRNIIGPGSMDQGDSRLTLSDEVTTLARVYDVRQRGHALARRLATMNDSDLMGALKMILDKALIGETDYVVL